MSSKDNFLLTNQTKIIFLLLYQVYGIKLELMCHIKYPNKRNYAVDVFSQTESHIHVQNMRIRPLILFE